MSAGHTPGPWRVQGCAIGTSPLNRICVTSDATDGGFVVRPRAIDGRDADTVTANARLIAAAPDLLAALESAAASLDEIAGKANCGCYEECACTLHGCWAAESAVDLARAAIAKAGGA